MSFNVLRDLLFWIVTASGKRRWARLADLAVVDGGDAPVAFDWPRADLNIASYELAIGLAWLLFQPETDADWHDLWRTPPQPDEVDKAAEAFVHAFNLVGDGPLFMQDFEAFTGETTPVEALLIDTPGANGQKKNADLLTWRGRYPALGLPAAALSLYALQQFAPAGGAGNRTSMRGGGPLTTLVTLEDAARRPAPLWRSVLANLPLFEQGVSVPTLHRALPWLGPTLLSDAAHGERKVSQADPDVDNLQVFFGQPRRIRLAPVAQGVCALTGMPGLVVTGFMQRAWGVNYDVWKHPMTPYRRQKQDDVPYSAKPKSGHFGYRDWVAAVYGAAPGGFAETSRVLKLAEGRAGAFESEGFRASLTVGGWAMNNMEAIVYLHAVKPLYLSETPYLAEDMERLAVTFAEAGETAHQMLRMALRKAHFSDGATVSTDSGLFEQARTAFYERTEAGFHDLLHAAFDKGQVDAAASGQAWLRRLRQAASALFTELTPDFAADPQNGRRVADAWSNLQAAFSGYGKLGSDLYKKLGMPEPVGKRRKVEA